MEKLADERARVWKRWPPPVMWAADYDYVRLTVKPGDGSEYRTMALEEAARRAAIASLGGEYKPAKRWGALGYRGWKIGDVAFGTSIQGAMLEASGFAASFVAAHAPPWDNAPRVDLQVTHWYETDHQWIIEAVRDRARAFSNARGATGAQVRIVDGDKHGKTAYIGARTSAIYCRSYEKGRKGKGNADYENAIRHEVEYKDGLGAGYWPQPGAAKPDATGIASLVYAQYKARGVYIPDVTGIGHRAIPLKVQVSGEPNPLAWYNNQVAASIRKAIADGYNPNAIMQALGVDKLATNVLLYRQLRELPAIERIEIEE